MSTEAPVTKILPELWLLVAKKLPILSLAYASQVFKKSGFILHKKQEKYMNI
jgi:hypothetical protein